MECVCPQYKEESALLCSGGYGSAKINCTSCCNVLKPVLKVIPLKQDQNLSVKETAFYKTNLARKSKMGKSLMLWQVY